MPVNGEEPAPRPTIRDVAERAGVSKSLVSLVLRGSPKVSPARRALVDQAIADLGYRPNAAARTLRDGSSRAIGVLLNDVRHPWFVDLLDGLISVLEADGRHVVLSGGGRLDRRMDDSVLRGFLGLEADGFILAGTQANSPVIAEIASAVPTVTVGWRDIDLPRVDAVANDDLLGATLATRHLIDARVDHEEKVYPMVPAGAIVTFPNNVPHDVRNLGPGRCVIMFLKVNPKVLKSQRDG